MHTDSILWRDKKICENRKLRRLQLNDEKTTTTAIRMYIRLPLSHTFCILYIHRMLFAVPYMLVHRSYIPRKEKGKRKKSSMDKRKRMFTKSAAFVYTTQNTLYKSQIVSSNQIFDSCIYGVL